MFVFFLLSLTNNERNFQLLVLIMLHRVLLPSRSTKPSEDNYELIPLSECFDSDDSNQPDKQKGGKNGNRGDKDQDGNGEADDQNK